MVSIWSMVKKVCMDSKILRCQSLSTKAKTQEKSQKTDKKPKLKTFKIYRYNPEEKDKKPRMQSFTIDLNDCRPMVLDALNKIKTEQDSSISYRRSCREGICGSCGMNIDGVNRLACLQGAQAEDAEYSDCEISEPFSLFPVPLGTTSIPLRPEYSKIKPRGTTKIYPLPHMYVVKDLVVDFNKFFDQHRRINPYLIREKLEDVGKEQLVQSIEDRNSLLGYAECILCACCSTSCPEYWWHGHSKAPNDFLGPAALLNAYRWIADSRDTGTKERLSKLTNYYNIFRCHQINNCTNCCPKRLAPGKAISKLRLLVTKFKKKKKADLEGQLPSDPCKACEPREEDD